MLEVEKQDISFFFFRVWDKQTGKHLPATGLFIDCQGRIWQGSRLLENFDGHLIIERCTGLKDKNGKLIYAGDVFEATVLNSFDGDEMIDKRIRGQVAYYVDEAAFTFAAYSPFNLSELEIIGNIHEKETEQCKK